MLRLLRNPRVVLVTLIVVALIAVAVWPRAVRVEVATIGRGALTVTIDEEGETRVRNRYVVSAPLTGRVLRIELEPGDAVKQGDVVARLQPEAPPLLDARSRAEALAAVESARAALGRARADEQRTRTALAQAQRELARAHELGQGGLATGQQLETRESDVRTAQDGVDAAVYAVRAAESDLQRAQARLAPATAVAGERAVDVRAPVTGVVLKRVRESESIVPAGDRLIEIGDPANLEIVSDLLSTDAVRVKPGARALVDQWGGDKVLEARVRRVEPSGFTKVSALGVEEQRVNVILDFADAAQAFAALGDAYRVEIRIVAWDSVDVLKVPTSALFRQGETWAVYTVADGRARARRVTLGHRTGQEAEILDGLVAGTPVILHPGDTLADDTRVTAVGAP